jgi:hypothetical protein
LILDEALQLVVGFDGGLSVTSNFGSDLDDGGLDGTNVLEQKLLRDGMLGRGRGRAIVVVLTGGGGRG